jgi:lysophospholipase L1-like esterase
LFIFPVFAYSQTCIRKASPNSTKPKVKAFESVGSLVRQNPPGAFNPLSVPNMLAWYDVTDTTNTVTSGGTVTELKDKSGNAYNMAGSGGGFPTYNSSGGANSLPYMSITNGQEISPATTLSTLTQPYTIYYVVKQNGFTGGDYILGLDNGNSVFVEQAGKAVGNTITMNAGSTYNRNANGYSANWQLLTMTFDNDNTIYGTRQQVNNEPFIWAAYTYNDGGPGNSVANRIAFGPYYKNSSYAVEELLVYSGVPSATNDSLVRTYLTNKYNIPKKKVALFFGDSITWGAESTNNDTSSFAAYLCRDSSWDIVNWGYPSSVAVYTSGGSQAAGRNGTNLYQFPIQSKVDFLNTFLFFCYGTNDRNNVINTDYIDSFKIMIHAYQLAGIPNSHIFVCTEPARQPGGISALAPIDSTMYWTEKNIATTMGVQFYDNITYEASTWSSSYIWKDGIHLTNAGHRAYASGLEAILP